MEREQRGPETAEGLVGDAMYDIVDEATRRAETQEQGVEQQERRRKRNLVVAGLLLPVCMILTALNISGAGPLAAPGPPAMSAEEARAQAVRLLSDAADELEVYWQERRSYPRHPAFMAGDEDEPFDYALMGTDRYVLSVTIQGQTVDFDSREDPAVAFAEVRDDG